MPGADDVCIRKERGTIAHIVTLLPQFRITVFFSKLMRLHGLLHFKVK